MKKHIAKLIVLFVLAGLLSIYWQIRNVDPEGACKGLGNFSMCWDAWMEYDHDGLFKKLPTDQKMIDNFKKYRNDFDAIKDKVISQQNYYMSFVNSDFRKQTGVWWVGAFGYWPSTTYLYSLKPEIKGRYQELALSFIAESTMYISGAEKNWPHINRQKGYAYFPVPAPQIENGHVNVLTDINGHKTNSWRVLNQLDSNWPTDWASYECLLRPIEPQWFLFICKDHIGG
jgi:hypothetical protein